MLQYVRIRVFHCAWNCVSSVGKFVTHIILPCSSLDRETAILPLNTDSQNDCVYFISMRSRFHNSPQSLSILTFRVFFSPLRKLLTQNLKLQHNRYIEVTLHFIVHYIPSRYEMKYRLSAQLCSPTNIIGRRWPQPSPDRKSMADSHILYFACEHCHCSTQRPCLNSRVSAY